MAYTPIYPTDAADLAYLLNRLGDELSADIAAAGAQAAPWDTITGKPDTYPPADHRHQWDTITGKPDTYPPAGHRHQWTDLEGTPDTYPPAEHRHRWTEVDGKPTTYPPADHQHAVADVAGLGGRLGRLEYDSGLRNITSLAGASITSGTVLLRRSDNVVTLDFDGVKVASGYPSGGTLLSVPSGFRRPARLSGPVPASSVGDVRRSSYMHAAANGGGIGIWLAAPTDTYYFTWAWITSEAPPATPPGSPA